MNTAEWGWSPFFEREMENYRNRGLNPGRIIRDTRHSYTVAAGNEIMTAEVSGAFRYKTVRPSDFPVIGDWVLFRTDDSRHCLIEGVMKRKSCFSRKAAGNRTEEQVIAANIDIIFLVFALNGGRNFTTGALERYLTLAWNSGATPVVILNKADLSSDEERLKAVMDAENSAPGVDIHIISANTGEGIEKLSAALKPGKTIALTGPSGVGKSTIINRIAGENLQKTSAVRESDLKGRHTTTHRQLFLLPSGLMLIDSPGLKELQLWAEEENMEKTFNDIAELAAGCRFRNCSHQGEPGCAVQEALLKGELELRRYENFLDLRRELNYLKTKQDDQAARAEKEKWKNIAKLVKDMYRERRENRF